MHTDPLVTMVVGGIASAFVLGFLAHKLRIPPIVGYLLAGILLGSYMPGVVLDDKLARELADLGIVLIMFGVGLKFSPVRLTEFRWIALPGALGQMALVTAMGAGLATFIGMAWIKATIFGFCLSLASNAALLGIFEDRREPPSPAGNLAISWLIVQNVVAVIALVFISALGEKGAALPATAEAIMRAVGVKALELSLFILIMLVVGRRILPGLLVFIARARSRELFSLGVVSMALGVAYAAHAVFAVSFALSAFVAGLVLNEASISHRAAEDLIPLRDAFAVLFFVSLGMLFEPELLVAQQWAILSVLGLILLGNAGVIFLMSLAFRAPLPQRIIIAGRLAQIGEVSLLIATTALSLKLMSAGAYALVAGGAVMAVMLNPLLRGLAWLVTRKREWKASADTKAVDAT